MKTYCINLPISKVQNIFLSCHDDDTSVQSQFKHGQYEPHVQCLLDQFCVGKKNILDIGANYGQHTVLMGKLNPDANIVSIEASAKNVEVLQYNLNINKIFNVRIIQTYLKDKVDKIDYYHWTGNAACAFGCTSNYGEKNHKEFKTTVNTKPLDDIINFEPDFVKMDIEGAELLALKGASNTLKNCPPLLIELNKFTSESFFNTKIEELIEYIYGLGYTSCYMCFPIKGVLQIIDVLKDDLLVMINQATMLECLFI